MVITVRLIRRLQMSVLSKDECTAGHAETAEFHGTL